MRKFSKILESTDHIVDIKEIFIDFIERGFTIKVNTFQGFYDIELVIDKAINWMECIKDLSVADDRMMDMNLYFVLSKEIVFKDKGQIKLKYKLGNSKGDKNVNGFKEFKAYCENILGVYGIEGVSSEIEGDADIDSFDNNSYFRINVVSEEGFYNTEYFGWELRHADNVTTEKFASQYPGYSDFLEKICKRRLNWAGVWDRDRTNGTGNPMNFDKEGIEAVEKLLEMAKKFPNKIKVIKP